MDAPLNSVHSHNEQSDAELMQAYADGVAGAFDTLYHRHKDKLYRYMYRQLDNAAMVDELYQDVWSRVIRARADFRDNSSFTAWLYRIAHNRLVDFFRSDGCQRELVEPIDDADEFSNAVQREPQATAINAELAQRLKELIGDLPPPQREAFLLKEEAGLSLQEIANVTGSDRETVKSRLRYAVNKLRNQLRLDDG